MCVLCVTHMWVTHKTHVFYTQESLVWLVCVSCVTHVCLLCDSCVSLVWLMCVSCVTHVCVLCHSCVCLVWFRPTQSIMYVPLQVNRSQNSILLIVQYKYSKSCSGDFNSQESDPPHKIMHYWIYYSTQLSFGVPPDRICQSEMICIGGVPVSKRHFGWAGP